MVLDCRHRQDCFTMLTVAPGPDIAPYHDRQIVVLPPEHGMDWLSLHKSGSEVLTGLPKGGLVHTYAARTALSFTDGVILQPESALCGC